MYTDKVSDKEWRTRIDQQEAGNIQLITFFVETENHERWLMGKRTHEVYSTRTEVSKRVSIFATTPFFILLPCY